VELELTPEQERLENEVYTYLRNNVPPELEDEPVTHIEGHGPVCRQLVRKLGLDGWAGIGWPREYGGAGGSLLDLALLFEELGKTALPNPMFSTIVLGALPILDAGSDQQKKGLLPRVAGGEVILTLALSEPELATISRSSKRRQSMMEANS
jgi:alkylation response protein AidB-like acyl-CoA dehydrogenase